MCAALGNFVEIVIFFSFLYIHTGCGWRACVRISLSFKLSNRLCTAMLEIRFRARRVKHFVEHFSTAKVEHPPNKTRTCTFLSIRENCSRKLFKMHRKD